MQTTIHSLDYEARGVARVSGKTVFVQGALPLETVRIRITQKKASFALADTEAVIEASPFRVQAACAWSIYFHTVFGRCHQIIQNVEIGDL